MIVVLIVFLAVDKKGRNMMKTISRQESNETETRKFNCLRNDIKTLTQKRTTFVQDINKTETREQQHCSQNTRPEQSTNQKRTRETQQ